VSSTHSCQLQIPPSRCDSRQQQQQLHLPLPVVCYGCKASQRQLSWLQSAHRCPCLLPPPLQKLHARLQPLLYFFVDAASAIDQEDPGWHLLTAVETSPEGVKVLGFATAYRLYHYPEGARLKLAQILVLPPHQGRGAGSLLLTGAQALADELDACDLAVSWHCR
jgi:hypothetical protein